MEKIFEKFINRKFVILDGAFGTYIVEKGFKGITPEIANIVSPEIVEKIYLEYFDSGSEIVLTNTFGANRRILSKKKIEDKFHEIIYKGVNIVKKLKDKFKDILIGGDIGPLGELLQPYGEIGIKDAKDIFYEVGKTFEKTEVDFLILETFQDLEELKIAYETLKEITSFLIIPCLTFNFGKEYRTLMGQKVEDYIRWAENNEISIVGSNCGLNSKEMLGLVEVVKDLTDLTLWIKPNAGKPKIVNNKIEYQENIDEFTENCLKMVEKGVKFIGGCCGTTPSYIKNLKGKLIKFL
ncbi:MAG: homocysteine S-methyltransferase family protein [Candidatus Omnitrophica bacterium]|nr:homocysteine S-methyltransferase family protein [Candidatus Omnitrophota bacterium]MCM8832769.1 homocysteine S-methyltransferase family protein [Candidatus Omnitrophota bacterium]